MEPSELLEYDTRLVAFTQEVPCQEGRPLSPVSKERGKKTKLVEYSSSGENSPARHVFMASFHEHGDNDEPGREYDN